MGENSFIPDPTPWAKAFETVVNTMSRHIGPSILTCFMAFCLYLGYETVQRGSFFDAIQILISSREQREQKEINDHARKLQEEIRQAAVADVYIKTAMQDILDGPSGDAIRLRLAVIHNGVNMLNGVGMLKYDIVMGVSERGRGVDAMVQNVPLSAWSDFLGDLLAGKCRYMDINTESEGSRKARLIAMGVTSFAVCPVQGSDGSLLGALFLSWDAENQAHAAIDLSVTMSRLRNAADRIGLVYATRPRIGSVAAPAL